MKKFKGCILICSLVILILISTITIFAQSEEIPSLYEAYQGDFLIGAAVNPLTIETHSDLLKNHFNSVTAENAMKFSSLEPGYQGNFKFENADKIVEFARENNMKVRGHVLVWHNQTPSWVFRKFGMKVSREELLARMKEHIDTVVDRYKDDVYAWDVVNEAISDNGSAFYRKGNPWYDIIGEDFIAKAFEYAHQADPEAKLFYNDYNAINPDKRDKIYEMLKKLIADGVPIDGVGIQAHWNIEWPSVSTVEAAIEKYASLGLEIQITELDLSVYSWGDNRKLTEPESGMMKKQARKYKELFELFKKHSDVITGITFWGVADDNTWLDNYPVQGRKNWPFLFDVNHQPKEGFYEVIEASK